MATRIGTGRGETLRGTQGRDTLDGRGGDDTLLGLGGDDLLLNGPGRDRLDGGPGLDTLRLHQLSVVDVERGLVFDDFDEDSVDEIDRFAGIEAILGSEEADRFEGSGRADRLFGAGDNDRLRGASGDDVLGGGDGEDDLDGGEGDDQLQGGDDLDQINGGEGDDALDGQHGDDSLNGDDGNDLVRGGADDDIVVGDDGEDRLLGDDGDDALFGGAGDDVLDGGRGRDLLSGDGSTGMGSDDTYILGGDARDKAFFLYLEFADDPAAFDAVGEDLVRGFGSRSDHVLDINLRGVLVEDDRNAVVDTRDFLDSNDDGRVTAADAEVSRAGSDLVLDIDAVLARSLGEGDYGTQRITLEGAGNGFAASRIEAVPEPDTTYNIPLVTENAILEPPIVGPDTIA